MSIPGLRPEAKPAWLALCSALERLADQGREPACQRDPDVWFAANYHRREQAAEACTHCPVLAECGAFADAQREPAGVWGGRARGREPAA